MQALTITGLTKIYQNGVIGLKGIDLSVEQADFFALLGPNGAGKSTTIGIITSLIKKTSGQVSVFGHNIDKELETAKSCIGLVPQEINFSIFEKVIDVIVYQAGYYGITPKLAKQRAEIYLKKLDLWDARHQVSMQLSGGMKRRLMIARALVHEPKLLILDEPTAGVDIEIRRSMWEFLRTINHQGTTIILTTHYLEEAEYLCKNIAIIHEGSIIENTSVKHLLATSHMETFVFDLQKPLLVLPETIWPFAMRLINPMTLEVDVTKAQSLNSLFLFFEAYHIEVTSVRNKANRLEELFLTLIAARKKQ